MELSNLVESVLKKDTRFIVITGGVCSSIGKGVLVSSLGVLLKNAGYSVSVVKWDPYLNVDPGTMSPLEHGEVFVTADGAETDLDLGHYERLLGEKLMRDSSVSSGQIFQEILDGERQGEFLGRCIQLVPHVVDAIKKRMLNFACNHDVDFVLVEIGGTIGDIEGKGFLEAIRQIRIDIGSSHIFHGHLSYVPFLEWTGEIKTKPTQHSVNALKREGLVPDCLFLRAAGDIPEKPLQKVFRMCGVNRDFVFQVPTADPIYELFFDLKNQKVCERVQDYFGMSHIKEPDLSGWQKLVSTIKGLKKKVTIALVAKYVGNNDPYISIVEAIKSAGYACNVKTSVIVIDAEKLEERDTQESRESWRLLESVDGVIVPGGFDNRGVNGKILTVSWAREHKIPYLGICLGLQVMLIECARSLVGLKKAHSTECDGNTPDPVIDLLPEQRDIKEKGASMRLGEYACSVVKNTKAYDAYGQDTVFERHRHRYEFNNAYRDAFEQAGVVFSGIYQEKNLVEIAELKDHPFMVGAQFHPEFCSSPLRAHGLFKAFLEAALKK